MTYKNKKVTVSVIYRSPSQNISEFDLFLSIFEKILSDINKHEPSLSLITGDFNTRSSSWWSKDINTTEELKLFSLTSSNGFPQLINEPTDIQNKQFFLYWHDLYWSTKSISKLWRPCIVAPKLSSSNCANCSY